ncbi:MAG: DegV family protein [Dehalococcoidia bacterium]|nr:DegV family protein [Dehalococcoidia bacterium]
MPKVGIVTDSSSLIPPETVRQLGIEVAPLHLLWDGKLYRDGIDMQPEEFFKRLRSSTTLPTTSGAIQAEFVRIFEALRGRVKSVVALLLSQDLSAAYNSAIVARKLFPEMDIELVDTRTSLMAMGFAVREAAKAALQGADKESVIKKARDVLAKAHVFVELDTLEWLRRGGRVNMPAAMMARWLKVKPIMTIKDGKASPVARPLTRARAMNRLIQLIKERLSDTPLHICVHHADAAEEAEILRKRIVQTFHPVEILTRPLTPIIGAHTGPGTLGVAFHNE